MTTDETSLALLNQNDAQLRLQLVDTFQADNMSKIQILIWICVAAMMNLDSEAALIHYRRAKPQQPLETVSFLNDVNIIFDWEPPNFRRVSRVSGPIWTDL